MKFIKLFTLFLIIGSLSSLRSEEARALKELQQQFINLKFGVFIHFGMPTYTNEDWPDPNATPNLFNPTKLDCNQWAEVASSAKAKYACFTTKHHSGFCLWDTRTTDYSVMKSPYKRDIVREYVDAFRKKGMRILLYYSILDTHHNIRPGWINTPKQTKFIKEQLTELLTQYGTIDCLVIDGWDAFWSRISYEDIPFKEIYTHIKSLQPNCLVSEHNAGKYPAQELFYTDIKHYEQNAGQVISKEFNQLPAQAGIPINRNWFWKTHSPQEKLKSPEFIVNQNLIPLNEAHCNFILNMAPNREGLIDKNTVDAFKEIGKIWTSNSPAAELPREAQPIIATNFAKNQKANSSWSFDYFISDFLTDDNYETFWTPKVLDKKNAWCEIVLDYPRVANLITIAEAFNPKEEYTKTKIHQYHIELFDGETWIKLPERNNALLVKVERFENTRIEKARLYLNKYDEKCRITEFSIYCE